MTNGNDDDDVEPQNKHLMPRGVTAPWRATLAPFLATMAMMIYCFNGELLQALQKNADGGHPSKLLNLVICHLGGIVFLPLAFNPSSYESTAHLSPAALSQARWGSILFSVLLMTYNYFWISAGTFLSIGMVTAVFQTSIAFVYIWSIYVFGESVRASKVLGVVLAVAGVILASGCVTHDLSSSQEITGGVLLALAAAIGVSVYQVLFKYMYGHLKNDGGFLMYFMAWISIIHLAVILPLVVVAHYAGWEQLQLPSTKGTMLVTAVTGVLASTVNMLTLTIVLWGSPMLMPCAFVLSIPLTVIMDIFLHNVYPARIEWFGHLAIVISVALILQIGITDIKQSFSKLFLPGSGIPPLENSKQ